MPRRAVVPSLSVLGTLKAMTMGGEKATPGLIVLGGGMTKSMLRSEVGGGSRSTLRMRKDISHSLRLYGPSANTIASDGYIGNDVWMTRDAAFAG